MQHGAGDFCPTSRGDPRQIAVDLQPVARPVRDRPTGAERGGIQVADTLEGHERARLPIEHIINARLAIVTRPDERDVLIVGGARDSHDAARERIFQFRLERATAGIEPMALFAFRLVAHTEQSRAIRRGDNVRYFAFGRNKDCRATLARARVHGIQRAAIMLFAGDEPKRLVVGREIQRMPGFHVAVKGVPRDS